ncbi:bi-domain-containing oxidoreductase, partial [Planctomycetota bacterium]
MNQLTQKLKSGEMSIQDLPMPLAGTGMVLVRNHYSLISAGTESNTVKVARKSLIGKAKERPEQVKQVIDTLKKQGPVHTYRTVMKQLDAYSSLGYSSAGVVFEVGKGVKGFCVGDKVACAGVGYANHAEFVSVPVNLCVKLPADADLKLSSYNTLGAIALQGVRQADLRLGESCAVIGLGLLGQLTCMILKASGIKAYGIDVDNTAVETAKQNCVDNAWLRSNAEINSQIAYITGGLGVDAVIITAGTNSLDPINFAGQIVRKKGRVIIVGAVPTGFERNPNWYEKELELKMSCSYGPGRYDLDYEEKGQDYPPAYVRWTENRNMQAFQDLIHSSSINLDYLTTHEFSLGQAKQAYDIIVTRSEPFLGMILKYDIEKPLSKKRVEIRQHQPVGKIGIGFIGAGSYAQGNLLPNIPKNDSEVSCQGVMDNMGATAKRVAERFGFEFCTSSIEDIILNDQINTVFIATRHDSHADYVKQALQKGKHVFVEKPICLTNEQLSEIENIYNGLSDKAQLMIGFNRRFAPHAVRMKNILGQGPFSMIYRINASTIPANTWIQDSEIGGGRIIGEVCHFIDFLTWLLSKLVHWFYIILLIKYL